MTAQNYLWIYNTHSLLSDNVNIGFHFAGIIILTVNSEKDCFPRICPFLRL
jgi:hypothetical protein